jgi:plasmid stability protein
MIALIARVDVMASITIRNLEDSLKRKLRVRAAQHGRSMEEEVRHILRAGLAEKAPAPTNLYDAIRRHIAPLGGVDLEVPPRGPMREPPSFDE